MKISVNGKKVNISIVSICIIEIFIILLSVYLGACWWEHIGLSSTINNMQLFVNNPSMILEGKYWNINMLWIFIALNVCYTLYKIYKISTRKKYIYDKEFGSAEFDEVANLDSILRNKVEDPTAPNMMMYMEENKSVCSKK